MALTSNKKRAQRRRECREKLAGHIYERLGLRVPPDLVRLQPCPKVGYAWSVAEGSEHLLSTNLSNGSVGVYESIIASLGHSLEAVHPNALVPDGSIVFNSDPNAQGAPFCNSTSLAEDGSFTATIRHLECENKELIDQLDQARSHSDALLAKVEEWETWAQAMEEQFGESQSLVTQLDEELRHVQVGMAEAVKLLQSFRGEEGSQTSQSEESENPFRDGTPSPNLSH